MAKWRNSFWIVTALVALWATMLPSVLWACPMMERANSALSAGESASLPPCCQDPGHGKCCHPLPQPPDSEQHGNFAALSFSSPAFSAPIQTRAFAASVVVPKSNSINLAPPSGVLQRCAATVSPLVSQSADSLQSGRAPPLFW